MIYDQHTPIKKVARSCSQLACAFDTLQHAILKLLFLAGQIRQDALLDAFLGLLGLIDQGGEVGAFILADLLHLFSHFFLEGDLAGRSIFDGFHVDGPHSQVVQLALHVLCLFHVVLEVIVYSDLHGEWLTR